MKPVFPVGECLVFLRTETLPRSSCGQMLHNSLVCSLVKNGIFGAGIQHSYNWCAAVCFSFQEYGERAVNVKELKHSCVKQRTPKQFSL